MHLNLFDTVFAAALVLSILAACLRGSAREMLHALLFGLGLLGGWLFLRAAPLPETQVEIGRLATSIGFYVMVTYMLTWGLMRMLAPLMLDSAPVGLRSRFWAGALATVKLCGAVFGVNLWYAVHSLEPYGQRIAYMPPFVQDSLLIRLSDKATDDLHRWLARQSFARYQFDDQGRYVPATAPAAMGAGVAPSATTPALPAADVPPAPNNREETLD